MCHHAWLIFEFLVETGFHYVGQAGVKLLTSSVIHPPQPPKVLGLQTETCSVTHAGGQLILSWLKHNLHLPGSSNSCASASQGFGGKSRAVASAEEPRSPRRGRRARCLPGRKVSPARPARGRHPPRRRALYLGELGDFLAHFQVHLLAIVHAVPSQLRGGRRGREFGCPGHRAAVIVLLPAHARGRHLPDRPQLGHLSPRAETGPRSNDVCEARAAAAASQPDTRRPPALASGDLPPATPESPLEGTGRSRRPQAAGTAARGRCPGLGGGGPGPGQLSPAPQPAPSGGVEDSAAPRVPLAARTEDLARLRREEETGQAATGVGGDMEKDAGAAVTRARAGAATSFPRSQAPPLSAPLPPVPQPRGQCGRLARARRDRAAGASPVWRGPGSPALAAIPVWRA
ncbi:hypothetical protein AAY473_007625 [Plecturocebus cupreus]